MKKGLVLLAFLLMAGIAGFAADYGRYGSYRTYDSPGLSEYDGTNYFTLEVGTGVRPLYMALVDLGKGNLAEQGLRTDLKNAFYPVLTLTEVWRVGRITEVCLTEGAAAVVYDLRQYERFGYDPQGKPRYDLTQSSYAGRKVSKPLFSLTGQVRFLWFQSQTFTVYSAIGAGFYITEDFFPLPELVPGAVRYGRNHFYLFLENNIGPYATLLHGGLGWKF